MRCPALNVDDAAFRNTEVGRGAEVDDGAPALGAHERHGPLGAEEGGLQVREEALLELRRL